MFYHVRTAILLWVASLTIADNPSDQFNDQWNRVEEAQLSSIAIDELLDKSLPVQHAYHDTGADYKILLTLPNVSAKDIYVIIDRASRKVAVKAYSFKYLPRELYYYSEVIPAGFSTDGEWHFTPMDTLTIAFPKDGTRGFSGHRTSSLHRSAGVGVLAEDPGILVKWSKSASESISYSGGEKEVESVVEAHPSSVEVKEAAAGATSISAGTIALLCTLYPIIKYLF